MSYNPTGGGGASWGSVTGTLSSQTDLQNALDAKQATLVSATNIKTINGSTVLGSGDLTVSGTDATKLAIANNLSDLNNASTARTNLGVNTTANIAASTNKNYVTDAALTVILNTSNTNSGDETTATIKTKLGAAATGADGYLTQTDWNTFNNKVSYVAPTISLELLTQATNQTITAGYSTNLNRKYTINSGITLTIGSGAIFRIH